MNALRDVESRRLKHVVQLQRIRATDQVEGPYVGLENIESWTGRLATTPDAPTRVEESAEGGLSQSQSNGFQPGDVLFGKLRPYLAKAWVADFAGRCTTEALVMRPLHVEPRFLLYALLQPSFINLVDSSTYGSKMPRAEWDFIGSVPVPLPLPAEQQAIADFLDRETARLDALVAAKQRVLDLLDEKRKAIIATAVTRGLNAKVKLRDSGVPWLGKVPADWEITRLRRVLASMDYGTSQSVEPQGHVVVLRMGDIRDGELDFSRVGYVDSVTDDLLLRPDDLLFNRTNSLEQIGKVAKFRGYEGYVSFASYLVRLRVSKKVDSEFLNYLLNSPYVLAWARAEALPAIGQANLNPNRYSYIVVAVPPKDEQQAIVEHVARETAKLDAVRAATERTIALLKERRAALIAAAVTGQLDVGAAA